MTFSTGKAALDATQSSQVAASPKCGGCFKPINPATSVQRPIYQTAPRYGRVMALPKPVIQHFCNIECRQLADNSTYQRRGSRF